MTTNPTILRIAAAALLATSCLAQRPTTQVLSGDNLTAGMVRTGAKFGPVPVGGIGGSVRLDLPGATHEKLVFARGVIPPVANGGPKLTEILTYPQEHVQDVEPIGDWSQGKAYFAVTHSQDNSGHFFVLETENLAKAPNEHEIYGVASKVDGVGVHHETFHQFAVAGQYNHPGDMSVIGDILVIAGQNWPGNSNAKLQIGPNAAPDAVLFYDVANPEAPKYLGKIELRTIAPALSDLSNLWAGKVGAHYYMSLGDGSRTFYFYATDMVPDAAKWTPATTTGVSFRGDTIVPVRVEGSAVPVHLSVAPSVDDYQAVQVASSNNGSQLDFIGAVRTYDIADSSFAARGSASCVHVSKRGRMTQVSVDRGFRNDLIEVESYSVHYGGRDVRFPPAKALLPLSDATYWNTKPSYYETIQTCDLDGDGKAEIIARSAAGLLAWNSDGTQLPGVLPFGDSQGYGAASVYRTIQTADVDGDGRDELLVRRKAGLFAYRHDGATWYQLPGSIALRTYIFDFPGHYETIQTADIDADGRDELLARTQEGLFAWKFDGSKWQQMPGSVPFSDAAGFDKPQYYETIQTADLDGDGRAEVLGRAAGGLLVYRFHGTAWIRLSATINISDALGFDRPEYYGTLQAADIDGDGTDEVLIRFATGMFAYRYSNGAFTQLAGIGLLSNANRFDLVQNWRTIQCADLDGDGRSEVLARYYWGLTASKFDGSKWTTMPAVEYVGDYNLYGLLPYTDTMQTADLDGDGRAEFLARLVTGLHVWKPEDLGFGRALPIGVARVGAPTTCTQPAPSLNVNSRPVHTNSGFRLVSEHAPRVAVGVQAFSGRANGAGLYLFGAIVHVDVFDPAFFTLVIASDTNGRFDLPLPLAGAQGVRFATQSLWINPLPCAGRLLSATSALDITVQ
ncbi:MAG: VCBS repeat-containing protein [Planctomycetes bacterium]|nr:VCBS repeat-containing protein [Planctomycetota bacterium]